LKFIQAVVILKNTPTILKTKNKGGFMTVSNTFRIDSNYLPKAKNQELVIQELGDETLVYNLTCDKAHHLNKTISLVWKNCDGATSVWQMTNLLEKELGIKVEEDFVWLALEELNKVELLEEKIQKTQFPKLSRRKVLLRYALPAVALPVVMSLVAPPAVLAQSVACIPVGSNGCTSVADCCPEASFCEGGFCGA
jgi:hypothetical protein